MRVPIVWYETSAQKQTLSMGRSSSSFFGQLASFKALWRTGRGLLDAVAGAMGVPLASLRSSWASKGYDADRFEAAFAAQLTAAGITPDNVDGMTADQANLATSNAAAQSKQPPQMLVAIAVVAGLLLLPRAFKGVF